MKINLKNINVDEILSFLRETKLYQNVNLINTIQNKPET